MYTKNKFMNDRNQKYLNMSSNELMNCHSLVRLTPNNVNNYLGFNIVFNSRGKNIIKRLNRISETSRTLYIDHPDLGNNLQIGRRIYAIKNTEIEAKNALSKANKKWWGFWK